MGVKAKTPTGWKRQAFSKILSVLKDGTHFSPKVFGGRNLYITSKNVRMGKLDLEDVSYIPDDEHQRIYSTSPVKQGDVLLTKDGAKTGNVCINTLKEEFSLLSSVAYLRGKSDLLLNEFLLQWLSSPRIQFDIKNDMAGQAITRLTLQKIGKFKILLPPLPEQKAIADLLSTWDEAIEKTEALIDAKQKQFQWLLRGLMTSATTHPSTKRVPLGHMLTYEQPTKYLVKTTAYVEDGSTPVLTANKSFILGYTNENEGIFNKHPVIIFDDFTTDIKYVKFPFKVKSSAMKILLPKNDRVEMSYIFAAMSRIKIPLGGHKRYWIAEYQFLDIPLPPIPEQKRIAHTLNTARREINLLKKLTDQYRTQKRGLMQKLLTGEWHVRHSCESRNPKEACHA